MIAAARAMERCSSRFAPAPAIAKINGAFIPATKARPPGAIFSSKWKRRQNWRTPTALISALSRACQCGEFRRQGAAAHRRDRLARLRIVSRSANLFEHGTTQGARGHRGPRVDLLSDRIAMAHAKDRDAKGNFAAAGKGIIRLPDFVGLLRDAGFNGPSSLTA